MSVGWLVGWFVSCWEARDRERRGHIHHGEDGIGKAYLMSSYPARTQWKWFAALCICFLPRARSPDAAILNVTLPASLSKTKLLSGRHKIYTYVVGYGLVETRTNARVRMGHHWPKLGEPPNVMCSSDGMTPCLSNTRPTNVERLRPLSPLDLRGFFFLFLG